MVRKRRRSGRKGHQRSAAKRSDKREMSRLYLELITDYRLSKKARWRGTARWRGAWSAVVHNGACRRASVKIGVLFTRVGRVGRLVRFTRHGALDCANACVSSLIKAKYARQQSDLVCIAQSSQLTDNCRAAGQRAKNKCVD